jgi:hypothetical protein
MGHNIAVSIGLLIWSAGTDALVARDVTASSTLAYHLHTIVLKMVEALGFTSAATAGLRQDILRFHQGQPYSEARSHAPNSSAAAALRLSWNGRLVNFTLLLKLLLADAISTLYRLTLDSRGTLLRTNPSGTSLRHS